MENFTQTFESFVGIGKYEEGKQYLIELSQQIEKYGLEKYCQGIMIQVNSEKNNGVRFDIIYHSLVELYNGYLLGDKENPELKKLLEAMYNMDNNFGDFYELDTKDTEEEKQKKIELINKDRDNFARQFMEYYVQFNGFVKEVFKAYTSLIYINNDYKVPENINNGQLTEAFQKLQI
jgi:hypothetical protein